MTLAFVPQSVDSSSRTGSNLPPLEPASAQCWSAHAPSYTGQGEEVRTRFLKKAQATVITEHYDGIPILNIWVDRFWSD